MGGTFLPSISALVQYSRRQDRPLTTRCMCHADVEAVGARSGHINQAPPRSLAFAFAPAAWRPSSAAGCCSSSHSTCALPTASTAQLQHALDQPRGTGNLPPSRPHNEEHRTDPPPSMAKPLGMLGHEGSVLGEILRGEHVSGIYLPEVRVLLAQSNTAGSRPMLRRSDHHHGDTRDHPKYERHPGRNRIHWH